MDGAYASRSPNRKKEESDRMGTYYTTGASKQDIIRELLDDSAYSNHKVIDKSISGNNLWVVIADKNNPELDRHIALYLLKADKDGWGYKPIDEQMGPYESNCPLRFLDMVPQPEGPYAGEFRERVRAYHKQQQVKRKQRTGLRAGETVKARYGVSLAGAAIESFRIESTKPLLATALAENGTVLAHGVKVSSRHLDIVA
jgi:hypothetical protein